MKKPRGQLRSERYTRGTAITVCRARRKTEYQQNGEEYEYDEASKVTVCGPSEIVDGEGWQKAIRLAARWDFLSPEAKALIDRV